MSNPFLSSGANPFEDGDDDDAESSTVPAVEPERRVSGARSPPSPDDVGTQPPNPFVTSDGEPRESNTSSSFGGGGIGLPAWMNPTASKKESAPPAAEKKSNSARVSDGPTPATMFGEGVRTMPTSDIEKREADLRRRELELERRERALRQDERMIKRPNWPPCKPIVYHNIEEDIPEENQRMVRAGYYAWLAAIVGYAWNWIIITIAYFSGTKTSIGDWFFASLVAAIGIPVSWNFWYQGLYKAGSNSNSGVIAYGKFFFHIAFHLLFTIWMILALPQVGNFCAGFFRMFTYFGAGGGAGTTLGFFALVNIVVWAITGLLTLYVSKNAVVRFRQGGGVSELKRQRQALQTVANAV